MAEGMIARIGQWCFRHRWAVLGAWVVVVAAGVLATGPVFATLADNNAPKGVESVEASDVLNTGTDSAGQIIGLVDRIDPRAPEVRDAVNRAAADLATRSDVRTTESPYTPGLPAPKVAAYLSPDAGDGQGQGLLLIATLDHLDRDQRNEAVDTIAARMHALQDELRAAGEPQARVRVGGHPTLLRQSHQAVQEDLFLAEVISLPITLLVLIFVFRGVVAAGIPVFAAVVSVAVAMLPLLGFSKVTDLDTNVVTVVSLLGLGLSIDYCLLLVGRYRDELGAGFAPEVAISRAWATAGRTIMFSALTVAAALGGLLVFDLPSLSALGVAGLSIAVVALVVSMTFTAALLGALRRWIKPARRADSRRGAGGRAAAATLGGQVDSTTAVVGDFAETGFFARVSRMVQRRPVLVAVLTSTLLLVAGAPLLNTTIKLPHLEQVPRSIESAQVADELASRFGLVQEPAITVVARTDPASLDAWAARWASDPLVARIPRARAAGAGLSTLQLDVVGDPQSAGAQQLVRRVRADRPAGGQSWVTGDAAILIDLNTRILSGLPWAVGLTLLAMVVLLFAMTGSVVVPVKAILANVVSLGAAFGVMNAVFERGWLSGPLHTLTTGGLSPFVIVIIFAFAFGLSMDYEVFLLGRISEYVRRGEDTDTAVRRGLQHTGRIITSAALLMVIVFGCFAAARIGEVEQIGLGLAVAVFIDATIVRCLLVPATMTLLGRWNWWAPAPLQRLHERIGLGERTPPEPLDETTAGTSELASTH